MAGEDPQSEERGPSRAEAVRAAVDQALQATAGQAQSTRGRAQDLVDELGQTAARVRGRLDVEELAQAAGRLRDLLDELRPPSVEELRELRARVEALERRLDDLQRDRRKAGG